MAFEGDSPFHTYNPYDSETFEFPFITTTNPGSRGFGKGVLCNWYNGCEPITQVLSTLLGSGYFSGFPWTPAIGYMFRNKKIPKLVFAYVNEFDNQTTRAEFKNKNHTKLKDDTNVCDSIVAIPGLEGSELTLSPAYVKTYDIDG